MAAGSEFVEGWLVAQVLGEGAYGEVRLLVHARSGAAVALKVARGAEAEGGQAAPAREAALHRALRHAHVLRCLGERTHQGLHYLFLEYAPGGELFDRIEPDVGMSEAAARRYWLQLLAGLEYLHGRGVAHRDIKPENLLLDARDQLKISDFGMATLFRHGTRERLLTRVCGTVPYAAPEVLRAPSRPYRAPPADLWAAALVLLAMLAGELPWERACPSDARFAAWSAWWEANCGATGAPSSCGDAAAPSPCGDAGAPPPGPWRKLSGAALALVRRALAPDASRRAGLPALRAAAWARARLWPENEERAWRSQPTAGDASDAPDELSAADMDALISYSQPAHADDVLLGAELSASAPHAVGRRMTRVWLRGDEARALAALADALGARGHSWRRAGARTLVAELGAAGGAGAGGRLRAAAQRCGGCTLLEFRRTRGCGLQFKRLFVELRDALRHLHAPPPDPH